MCESNGRPAPRAAAFAQALIDAVCLGWAGLHPILLILCNLVGGAGPCSPRGIACPCRRHLRQHGHRVARHARRGAGPATVMILAVSITLAGHRGESPNSPRRTLWSFNTRLSSTMRGRV